MQFSFDTNLDKIARKVEAGERLAFDEGILTMRDFHS
jgi:hypothetical protein